METATSADTVRDVFMRGSLRLNAVIKSAVESLGLKPELAQELVSACVRARVGADGAARPARS